MSIVNFDLLSHSLLSSSSHADTRMPSQQQAALLTQRLLLRVPTPRAHALDTQSPLQRHMCCSSTDSHILLSPVPPTQTRLRAAQAGNGAVYAALTSPAEVRVWDGLQRGFAEGSTLPLPEGTDVHSLHTASGIDGVVVVFEDGSCELLARGDFTPPGDHRAASPTRGKKRRRKDHATVIWVELLTEHKTSTSRVLMLTRAGASGDGEVRVSSRLIPSGATELSPAKSRALQAPGCGCLTACFQWPSSLYTLWEDGSLRVCDIGRGGATLDLATADGSTGSSSGSAAAAASAAITAVDASGGLALVQAAVFRGFSAEEDGDRQGVAVMVASTTSHLAILARVGSPTELRGFLWDTAFGTLQADADVGKFTGVQWSPNDTVTGGLGKGPQCAIFSTSGTVVALNFPEGAAAGTLAAAVNKLGSSRRVVTDDWALEAAGAVAAFQAPVNLLGGKGDGGKLAKEVERRSAAVAALVAKAVDPSTCGTAAALDKAVAACIDALSDADPASGTDGGLQHHAATLVRRCLSEARYFPAAAIERLLAMRCLSCHHCPEVLSLAVEKRQRSLLRACLVHLDGVTEAALLGCFHTLHARNGDASPAPVQGEPETEMQEFLRLSYARGWNEEELIRALRPVKMDGVLCLAENLRWWLARLGEAGVKDAAAAASEAAGPTPNQAQVGTRTWCSTHATCHTHKPPTHPHHTHTSHTSHTHEPRLSRSRLWTGLQRSSMQSLQLLSTHLRATTSCGRSTRSSFSSRNSASK
jgi:hypothetical protein